MYKIKLRFLGLAILCLTAIEVNMESFPSCNSLDLRAIAVHMRQTQTDIANLSQELNNLSREHNAALQEQLSKSARVDGEWSGWSSWGTCSTTCDAGLQTRDRNCSNPRPSNGGEHCFGDSVDYRPCSLKRCPGVDGEWSGWSSWGTCSTTCEAGLQKRHRNCSNPRPSNGGEHCFGDSTDYRPCSLIRCPDTAYIPKVAFNAREAANLTLQSNQVIVFKTVIMNYGSAYNSDDGTFYAPVDGFYQFNGHLCVVQGGKNLDYTIRIDSTAIVSGEYRAPSDASDGKCIGFGAAAVVSKSQKVTVSVQYGYSEAVLFQNSNDWNSFSGVLINTL